jgi:hypothetical protein
MARFGSLCVAFLLFLGAGSVAAQPPSGSVVESRTLVGLQVAPAALAPLMPEGWTAIPFPAGPMAGANAMMSFLDGHAVIDSGGKTTGTRLTAALIALGKPPEGKELRMFVLRVYTDDPGANPYGNTHASVISRDRTLAAADGKRRHAETWTVTPDSGGQITFTLDYEMGLPRWSTGTSKSFSAADPDTMVTQTYQQTADLVLSRTMGLEIDGAVALASTLDELAPLFDGTQEIVTVVNIPVYIREVFLP